MLTFRALARRKPHRFSGSGKAHCGFSPFLSLLRLLYVSLPCDTNSYMETVRTIVCKLDPTPEQAAEIDATLEAFAAACNRIAEVCRAIHSTNKVKAQQECYAAIRADFGLSANLTIRAIARVCAALKVKEKMHSAFAPTSIDYDQRIFSFREWDWTFSLTLLHSRQHLEAKLGDRQRAALKGQNPTSATLVKRRDGRVLPSRPGQGRGARADPDHRGPWCGSGSAARCGRFGWQCP